jgi:hypothetical protein
MKSCTLTEVTNRSGILIDPNPNRLAEPDSSGFQPVPSGANDTTRHGLKTRATGIREVYGNDSN